MAYLIVSRYHSEAERKRIEYTFERWAGRLNVRKPEGTAFLVEGGEISAFLEDLYSRTPKENVTVFTLSKTEPAVGKTVRETSIKVGGTMETAKKIVSVIMVKQKAVLMREREEPLEQQYSVSTRKGIADIVARMRDNAGVEVYLKVGGYGDVVDFVYGKLVEELNYYKEA